MRCSEGTSQLKNQVKQLQLYKMGDEILQKKILKSYTPPLPPALQNLVYQGQRIDPNRGPPTGH